MEARERTVRYYENGEHCPFREWMNKLKDGKAIAAIDARMTRFRTGNLGKSRPIGDGASESVIDLGPGYRIYYGEDGNDIIVLNGGDKGSQASDIDNALSYWRDYKGRKTHERK